MHFPLINAWSSINWPLIHTVPQQFKQGRIFRDLKGPLWHVSTSNKSDSSREKKKVGEKTSSFKVWKLQQHITDFFFFWTNDQVSILCTWLWWDVGYGMKIPKAVNKLSQILFCPSQHQKFWTNTLIVSIPALNLPLYLHFLPSRSCLIARFILCNVSSVMYLHFSLFLTLLFLKVPTVLYLLMCLLYFLHVLIL